MSQYWLSVVLVRIILPVVLAGSAIWRPVGLSLVYLVLMLCSPMLSIPTHKSMNSHTGRFLKTCFCLSLIVAVAQITFHIVLLALPPYGYFLENCELLEKIFRHLGLVRLDDASVFEIFFWLAPEIIVPPTTLLVYYICRQLTSEPARDDEILSIHHSKKKTEDRSEKIINILGSIGSYVVLASLCWTAALNPSVEGGFYFLVFLGAATWWACNRELLKGFAVVCRIVMFIVILHIITLLSYQNQWPQEFVPVNSTWSRYFALSAIYTTNCSDPRDVQFIDDSEVLIYGYALRLFWLYYILALQSQFLARKPAKKPTLLSGKLENVDTLSRHVSIRRRTPSQRWQSARRKARRQKVVQQQVPATERTPLMRFGSGRTGLLQDSTGSVIVQDGHQDDSIQLQSLSEGISEDKPGVIEHIIMAVYSVFQLVVNSSYLATNIIMMTWSIMYHSWTTFALLMWALILWMVPNKRASMMKCSPFIVFYATVLILVQYVYSMDLTNDEMPEKIHGITIAEIGFTKRSCWHLIVKCLFMSMFWITMRQYTAERKKQRRTSTIRDMVAPLHVTMSAATAAMNQDSPEIKSKFIKDFGKILQKFLTKFWIAIVAIMLFTSGIMGSRMTVFRIIYMSLFLLFVISFQISWRAWRRMMYGFWIIVIGYSIIMLILVYTYQFKNFPSYWSYIYINKELQNDIGLETYETKDLFVRLLTPTFIVIITVLQIHYFHDDFLQMTNIERQESSLRRVSLGHSPNAIPVVSPTEVFLISSNDEEMTYTLKQLKHMSKMERMAFFRETVRHLYNFYNYVWLFFELHMQKIICISLMLLCVHDVCAINFCFVLVIVIIINFSRNLQIMAINVVAATIALLMVAKMLYQIEYVHHEYWDVNCTRDYVEDQTGIASNNTVYNIAEWIGMRKAAASALPDLLKGYIGIITVTTLRAIVTIRQWFYRQANGEPLDPPQVMFPKISRGDADKDISSCLKFLFNFGFYKFGLEFCLMAIVALIGTRLDFYSVLYSIWLIILFSLKRKIISKLWPVFKLFVIILLPIQYALVVAPPTWFCIQYPWSTSEILRRLQEWMYLPDPDFPPNPKKLICDFILLLMIVRQSLVFRIEQRSTSSGQEFIAGHNYSVYSDLDKPNFVNPVKDYVSHIHNWLDILKRGSFMSLMWITLSIMFLAGTKRTNIFSLGYLIGAFVFLWQGSDLYLRPVKTILKWWNMLIGYNVIVIFSKALLQGVGCVLIKELESSACWLIQLLGIACLKKFQSSTADLISSAECEVPREDIGMVWDGLCFGFLLIQKRLFKSYYFFHIVDETKAMSVLASRGAELLEELHQKRIIEQDNTEKAALQKLKFKMDKIKANQRKIQGPSYREPATHKIGVAPLAKSSSMSSCISSGHTPPQGYQTPIDEDDDEPPQLTPRAASLLQAPSPNSAILTVSLEGYLEPTRISFGSPPSSELNPRGPSPDETFPVFSPPPYDQPPPDQPSPSLKHRRQSSFIGPPWMNTLRTPRASIVSSTSRSARSHHTYSLYSKLERPLYRHRQPRNNREAVRSGDYYMFDDLDDDDVTDLVPGRDQRDEEERRRQQFVRGRRMTVSELMHTLIKTDIEIATHVALYGGTEKDALRLRRESAPQTRKKSSMSYLSAHSDSDTAAATDAPDQTSLDSGEVERKEKELKDADLSKSPHTSDEEDDDDTISGKDRKEETGKKVSIFIYFKFAWAILNSTMVSMTKYLNRFSSDYRYIRKVLAKEKKNLKAKPDFRMGMRLGINQIWQPIPIVRQSSSNNGSTAESLDGPETSKPVNEERKGSSLIVPRIRILAPSLERGLDMSSSSSLDSENAQDPKEEPELSEVDQPPVIQLAASIWFGILAHSTLLCYFMVFLHQIKNASILSTPLPLMVFFWGSLTVPRPSKTFWVTVIAYTEIIVIVKCIFQLELIPWNQSAAGNNPLFGPRIVGIERKPNYALWDLLLLLMVFFHRFMLKSLGQWTRPFIKPRKVIPSKLTMVIMRPDDRGQGEPSELHIENENKRKSIDLETPQGRRVSIFPEGDSEQPHTSNDANVPVVAMQSRETDPLDEKLSKAMSMTTAKYLQPIRAFFRNILNPVGKEKTNVYAYMFFCDFFNFLLLIFGFSAFGTQQGDGGVTAYLVENRVPMPFLLMLLLQFALIVIDRALFLRKSILGKLIFQYCLIFGIHIWMFFILPSVTERQFTDNLPPQIWYMVKCFYLLLAAYQLRLGYPTRILGNFLCKKYTIVNFVLFKGFMVIPLLFELRAVMDWIWTDTSMTIMDWFKMEDIYANIYQLKCMRGVEADFPQPRGQKKSQSSKYMVGGAGLFFMIGLVWFPLLFFALGRTVGVANLPYEVSLKISIGPYEPIYRMSAQDSSIFQYTETDYDKLADLYARDRSAVTFLENYLNTDVAAVRLSGSSRRLWDISPPDRVRLKTELESNSSVTIHVEWTVSRKTDAKDFSGITTTQRDIKLPAYVDGQFNPKRQELVNMLSSDNSTNPDTNSAVLILNAFPKFLKVTSRITDVVPQLMRSPHLTLPTDDPEEDPKKMKYLYRNITIQLLTMNSDCCAKQQWWITEEDTNDPFYNILLKNIPLNDRKNIMMFLFNEKVFPESLSFISGFGILGFYSIFLYMISQVIRRGISDVAPKIMFDDLPYVDRVLRLCLDIYLVRESKDLSLEEDLFAKLIFLYRSPETLIRWSRPPEPGERSGNEDGDDDDDDDDGDIENDEERIQHQEPRET